MTFTITPDPPANIAVAWDPVTSKPYSTQWDGYITIWDNGATTWDNGATTWGDEPTYWME